jgi:transcriptional regulator with XRE-family HTH domain
MQYLTLGSRIRSERERLEMSRAELARLVGVAGSQVTRWEAGEYKPSTQALVNLARALDMDPLELMAAACADAS